MINLKIEYKHVLMRMGANIYRTKIDNKTKDIISESVDFVKKILSPKYVVCFAERKVSNDKIILSDGFTIKSNDIIKLTDKSDIIYGFAATVGKTLDDKINGLIESKDNLKAYIFDAIGSVAVEEMADIICSEIKAKYAESTIRFSPGYGDWHLLNQKDFLKWLGTDKIGIKLLKSYQMIPQKSVSAVFGVKE